MQAALTTIAVQGCIKSSRWGSKTQAATKVNMTACIAQARAYHLGSATAPAAAAAGWAPLQQHWMQLQPRCDVVSLIGAALACVP